MAVEISSVGATAVLTAHMRALESSRPDRLFDDALAETLVRASGLGIENLTLDDVAQQRIYQSLAVRTRYLDDCCERLLTAESGRRQVVILGAGLDTRALRLGWLEHGVAVFEVDREDVVALKTECLGHDAHEDLWHGVVADLTSPTWIDSLAAAGFDRSVPTVFIAEGLFMYLAADASKTLLDDIAAVSAPGSHLLVVHFGRGALRDEQTRAMSSAAGENGYAFQSLIDSTPAEWLGAAWQLEDALSIAQHAPSLGRRLPYDEDALGAELTWMIDAQFRPSESA